MKRPLVVVLAALLLAAGFASPSQASGPTGDPSGWTDRQLALRLVMAGYDMRNTDAALPWVRDGLGGVLLLGRPPGDLGRRLAGLRAEGSGAPLVASDEEGGQVQRLDPLLPRLPSAETLGRTRTLAQTRELAVSYGRQMRALGVDVSLAPVADLAIPGKYIAQTNRAYSADPSAVAAFAGAWQAGLREAGVVPVAKHWPGHGQAANTHDRAASTPALSVLESRDLLPFTALLQAGVPAVMLGHLAVPGLTEPNMPATLSPRAYDYLRERAGPDRLLLTDSMSMGAITRGLGLTPAQGAVRALRAGADMVLVDTSPGPLVDAISRALSEGSYSRSAAVASARRVLAVRQPGGAATVPPVPAVAAAVPAEAPVRAAVPPPPVSAEVVSPPPPRIVEPQVAAPVPSPARTLTPERQPVALGPPQPLRLQDVCDCAPGTVLARKAGQ